MVGLEDDLRTNEASRIWQSVCHKRAGARNAWKTRPCQPWCSRAKVDGRTARAWGAKWITVNHTRTQKNKRNDLSGTVINKYLLLRFLGRVLPKSVCRALCRGVHHASPQAAEAAACDALDAAAVFAGRNAKVVKLRPRVRPPATVGSSSPTRRSLASCRFGSTCAETEDVVRK